MDGCVDDRLSFRCWNDKRERGYFYIILSGRKIDRSIGRITVLFQLLSVEQGINRKGNRNFPLIIYFSLYKFLR